jgi:molybdopterin/thiamine biosynthesis adenylyltransferase
MGDSELHELLSSIEGIQIKWKLEKSEYPLRRDIHFAYMIAPNEFPDMKIIIAFDCSFPNSKPQYFIKDVFIPHVESDGFVCYSDVSSMVNPDLPKEIIEETFFRLMNTIRDGLSGENKSDFRDEFAEYWHRSESLDKNLIMQLCTDVPEDLLELRSARFNNSSRAYNLLIGRNDEELKLYAQRFLYRQMPGKSKMLLVATIMEKCDIEPPKYNAFWSLSELRAFLRDKMNPDKLQELYTRLRSLKKCNSKEYFILGIPTKNGKVLVGMEFSGLKTNKHPLLPDGENCRVKPLRLIRSDKKLISERGGAEGHLHNKKVLLVGAGSVGSKLAFEIVKLGISHLTIIDNDFLDLPNLYRHELGVSSLHKNKAKAVSEILNKEFPYAIVNHYDMKLDQCIATGKINLGNFDLIVSATGEANVGLFLNKFLKENKLNVPSIYSWNEALGIGGHACLISETMSSCFQCLYKEDPGFQSRVSFSEPDQDFNRKLAGCSTSFVPFSSLDSMRTAVLTIGLIKDFFTGLEVHNQIISWKGSDRYFLENGFKTSGRYNLTENSLWKNRFHVKNLNEDQTCRICG